MFSKATLILCLLLIPASDCHAGNLYDFVVGGTIKNLAKIYVKTSNLPKLKAKYIKKIANMKEDKFKKHYMKFYEVYKDLPTALKQKYVFTDTPNKAEIIHSIDTVNKRDLITIINKIPSDFITKKAKIYAQPSQEQLSNHSQMNGASIWGSLVQKI